MSAQINLYHPRFLKKRDLLTLTNVAAASVVMLLVVLGGGIWASNTLAAKQAEATAASAEFKAIKDQFDATAKAAGERKPSPQMAADVVNAELLLQRREEIVRVLESGAVGNSVGFADYLRGFARQAPEGLWLTGFVIGSGGNDMEIHGRMLSSVALPDYIRRLGTEAAFRGRNFAALTLDHSDKKPVAVSAAVSPAPTSGPARYIDFVLTPQVADVHGAKP